MGHRDDGAPARGILHPRPDWTRAPGGLPDLHRHQRGGHRTSGVVPQRVFDVVLTERTQVVITLGDLRVRSEGVDPAGFAPVLHAPLTGNIRRWALESFGLNVDCENCGSRGRHISYGLPSGNPGPHEVLGGCLVEAWNPDYVCGACNATWRVLVDGQLEFTHREPPLWGQT